MKKETMGSGMRFVCASFLNMLGTRLRHFIKVCVFMNVRICEERFWHFIRTHVAIDYSCMVMSFVETWHFIKMTKKWRVYIL